MLLSLLGDNALDLAVHPETVDQSDKQSSNTHTLAAETSENFRNGRSASTGMRRAISGRVSRLRCLTGDEPSPPLLLSLLSSARDDPLGEESSQSNC